MIAVEPDAKEHVGFEHGAVERGFELGQPVRVDQSLGAQRIDIERSGLDGERVDVFVGKEFGGEHVVPALGVEEGFRQRRERHVLLHFARNPVTVDGAGQHPLRIQRTRQNTIGSDELDEVGQWIGSRHDLAGGASNSDTEA